MAIYKNARVIPADLSPTAFVPAPSTGQTAIVKTILITNNHTSSVNATIEWVDSSNSNAVTRIIYDVAIPASASFIPIANSPLILEEGDSIRVYTSLADKLEFTAALEIF